jgi:glycosyltransferase involved in cell wall biosynthesis
VIRLSLIVAVLQSHEIVRRQLLHLDRILTSECELVVVDDGSTPSLEATCAGVPMQRPLRLHLTHDTRPWTQGRARNIGASLAAGEKLLFFDIDHILTAEIVTTCARAAGDKLHWTRRPATLAADGTIIRGAAVAGTPTVHVNSFCIRRALFERLGGYDDRFCGQYGGEDHDFNRRYAALVRAGAAMPEIVAGEGWYYADAERSPALFHGLRRRPGLAGLAEILAVHLRPRRRTAEAIWW